MAHSQALYEALLKIQEEMGGEAALENRLLRRHVQDPRCRSRHPATMQPKAMTLVIGHGSQYGTSVAQIAPRLPRNQLCLGAPPLDTFPGSGYYEMCSPTRPESQQGWLCEWCHRRIDFRIRRTGRFPARWEAGDAKLYVDGFRYWRQGCQA